MTSVPWKSSLIRNAAAMALPWSYHINTAAQWCMHVVLWIGLVALLTLVNRWMGMERFLHSPWPILHKVWLPLLALFVYVFLWLCRGLYLAWDGPQLLAPAADYDTAWNEMQMSLDRTKIDLQSAPVFLVLGSGELTSWFSAGDAIPLTNAKNSTLRAFGAKEALFMECNESGALEHTCRRLVETRTARVPVQGIVIVVPVTFLQSAQSAEHAAESLQEQLAIVRQTTGLEIPLYFGLAGFESMPGASTPACFLRFPPMPDLDPADIPGMFQESMDWLFVHEISAIVRKHLRVDAAPREEGTLTPTLQENVRLMEWLIEVQGWRRKLVQYLLAGTETEFSEPGMVAGCYFLPKETESAERATHGPEKPSLASSAGGDAGRALLHDLLAHQSVAMWTPDAIAAADKQRRQIRWMGNIGMIGVATCLVGGIGLVVLRMAS